MLLVVLHHNDGTLPWHTAEGALLWGRESLLLMRFLPSFSSPQHPSGLRMEQELSLEVYDCTDSSFFGQAYHQCDGDVTEAEWWPTQVS